ncbi:hypothetical protein [Nostoc sp.]|uniref:hypothetical protein n=1 Tax=Nostoc sp. TaxID=1180 RepID=UPI003FA563BB
MAIMPKLAPPEEKRLPILNLSQKLRPNLSPTNLGSVRSSAKRESDESQGVIFLAPTLDTVARLAQTSAQSPPNTRFQFQEWLKLGRGYQPQSDSTHRSRRIIHYQLLDEIPP